MSNKKLNEEEFFTKIYTRGFDDRAVNQLLKLYSDGYDLSYIDINTDITLLRDLRDKLKKSEKAIQNAYKYGIDDEKDILKFLYGNYSASMIIEILDLESYHDITPLMNPNFSDEQFELLSNGVRYDYDVSWFANPDIPIKRMEVAFDATKKDIDLSKYLYRYEKERLKIFLDALIFNRKEPIEIDFLDNEEFTEEQMRTIFKLLCKHVDVSSFADPKFNPSQMSIIGDTLEKYNFDLTKYIDETYSANEMLIMRDIFKKSIHNGEKIVKSKYNEGQLSIFKYYLEKEKDIEKILNNKYSVERMKLIMECPSYEITKFEDLSISDLNLHLYRYGFINSATDKYDDIDDVCDLISEQISKKIAIQLPINPVSNSNVYYNNRHEILEIEKKELTDEEEEDLIKPLINDLISHFVVNFGVVEIEHILNMNENKVNNFLNKYFITNWNDNAKRMIVTSLITGDKHEYRNSDLNNILNIKNICNFFNQKFNEYYFDYYTGYSINEGIELAFQLFSILDINPEDYYILENVYDKYGHIKDKLCVDKNHIGESNFFGMKYTEEDAYFDLKQCVQDIELMENNFIYRLTFYDMDGIVEETIDIYSRSELNDFLNKDCNDFEYFGKFKSIDACLNKMMLNQDEDWHDEIEI